MEDKRYTPEQINAAKEQLKKHKALFRLQLSLLDPKRTTEEYVRICVRKFQPFHLDEVAEERMLNGMCGYLLCTEKPMDKRPGRVFIDGSKGRMLDGKAVCRFCSLDCFDRLEILKIQLPMNKASPPLQIPLAGINNKKNESVPHPAKAVETEGADQELNPFSANVQIVEHEKAGPTSENFPAPGSKVSPYLVEGYRQSGEDGSSERSAVVRTIKEKKAAAAAVSKKENEFLANQISQQLRELGINDEVDPEEVAKANESDYISEQPHRPEKVENGGDEGDIFDDDQSGLDETEIDLEEFGPLDDDDVDEGVAGFLDLEEMRREVAELKASFQFTTLMKLSSALNNWKKESPEEYRVVEVNTTSESDETKDEGMFDSVTASRFQVVSSSLLRACGPIVESLHVNALSKPLAIDLVAKVCKDFDYSRPAPSLSVPEWQIVSACLLHAIISKEHASVENNNLFFKLEELETILAKLAKFTMCRTRAKLDEAESKSLLVIARSLLR